MLCNKIFLFAEKKSVRKKLSLWPELHILSQWGRGRKTAGPSDSPWYCTLDFLLILSPKKPRRFGTTKPLIMVVSEQCDSGSRILPADRQWGSKKTAGSLTRHHPEFLGNKIRFCGFDSQTIVCCGKWITMFVTKSAFFSRFTPHWSMVGRVLMILHRSFWNLLLHDTFACDCSVLELWMLTSWLSAITILRS